MLIQYNTGFFGWLDLFSTTIVMSRFMSSGSVQFLYLIISLLLSVVTERTQSAPWET
jgi:hypothetical protein